MSGFCVTDLFIYPVKSCAPLKVNRTWVGPQGLASDRRYMLVDPSGIFMTARHYPKLTHLLATPIDSGLVLAGPSMPSLTLQVTDYPTECITVDVWKQRVQAQSCGVDADNWLTQFLGVSCHLVYFSSHSERSVLDSKEHQVGFADGYPLLMTSNASLDWLQQVSPVAIDNRQFRANVVVSGDLPFAEDGWLDIKIGEVALRVHSPCERCKLITLAPGQVDFNKEQEPLRTLLKYRRLQQGGAIFGQNLLVRQSGIIAEGMPVQVLAHKAPPVLR